MVVSGRKNIKCSGGSWGLCRDTVGDSAGGSGPLREDGSQCGAEASEVGWCNGGFVAG